MLPVLMSILSMAKQKADAENANREQMAQNIKNQNVNGQPQVNLQMPQQTQQQNNANRLQQVMSLWGK